MAERGDGPPGTYMPEIFAILSTELKGYTDPRQRSERKRPERNGRR
jgi:hypothetical protein